MESVTHRKPWKADWSGLGSPPPPLPALMTPPEWEMQAEGLWVVGGRCLLPRILVLVLDPKASCTHLQRACFSLADSPLVLALQHRPRPWSLLGNGIFFLKTLLELLVNEKFCSLLSLGAGDAGQPLLPSVVWGGSLKPSAMLCR